MFGRAGGPAIEDASGVRYRALVSDRGRRWKLVAGTTADEVLGFVHERIVPAYRRLSSDVELGLEVLDDGTGVVTMQRWRCREAHDQAVQGAAFSSWWTAYQPTLQAWHSIVDFDAEWASSELLP